MALYASEDRIARWLREKTISRASAVIAFLVALYTFRNLWPVFVSFVLSVKALGWCGQFGARRFGVSPKLVLWVVTALFFALLAVIAYSGFETVSPYVNEALDSLPRWQREVRGNPLFRRVQATFRDFDALATYLESYATAAVGMISTVGRYVVQAGIGFLLALVFLMEVESLEKLADSIRAKSLGGRLLRWTSHLADAIAVTVQLQLVVAVFNTVTTLPVLLALGVPNIPSLMALVFFAALIPVLGNIISGAVLCFFAFTAKGWFGVAIFLGVTALLGKVESYYLSPRLTARHVKMPSFVLVASLVAFEQLFGFAGFFLSFPFLFVAGRVRAEFREEDGMLPPRSVLSYVALSDDDNEPLGSGPALVGPSASAPQPAHVSVPEVPTLRASVPPTPQPTTTLVSGSPPPPERAPEATEPAPIEAAPMTLRTLKSDEPKTP